MVQTHISGPDLAMDFIMLDIGKSQIVGSGITKNFAERNPFLEVNFRYAGIALEEIVSLRNSFEAQGNVVLLFSLKGPMDTLKGFVSGRLFDCSLKYPQLGSEPLEIEFINGQFELQGNQLKLKDASIRLANSGFNIDSLLLIASTTPEVSLQVSWPQEFLAAHSLPLQKLQCIVKGKMGEDLSGDLEVYALYVRKDAKLDMRLNLGGIRLDYKNPKEKRFSAKNISLAKDNFAKIQKLNFTDLSAKVSFDKKGLAVRDLTLTGYNALLSGELKVDTAKTTALTFALKGSGLDVEGLMKDMNISNKLLSGTMDLSLSFDNSQKKFLEGSCTIKDGFADLGVIASIIALPALNNLHFDSIYAGFYLTKEIIRVDEVKATSPDVLLQGSWDANGKIDGKLNLSITSELLKQSDPFRRLLQVAQLDKQYVDFDFLLKGDPKNPRVMWLKGEFKDKLKKNLPGWAERRIEEDIDQIISGLSDQ